MNPYSKVPKGKVTDYSTVPLKYANPWHKLDRYAPPAVYGDNLEVIGEELQKIAPARNRREKVESLYDIDATFLPLRMAPKEALIHAKGGGRSGFTMGHKIFYPEPGEAGYSQNREYGMLEHEQRHVVARDKVPEFLVGKDQQATNSFGEQIDHFPDMITDRGMANSLKALNLAQTTPPTREARVVYPWLGDGKKKPKLKDLLDYVQTHFGWRGVR